MLKGFIDTNMLLYAKDATEPSKQKTAARWIEALLQRNAVVLSAQSLREYYSNMLRLDRRVGAVQALRAEVGVLQELVPDELRVDYMESAWAIQDRHKIGFYDSLLVASALAAGCAIFLSEDLNGGQKIDTLTIINPFTTAPDAILSA